MNAPVFSSKYLTNDLKSYKSSLETAVRGFVKACLNDDVLYRYGVPFDEFNTYKSLIDFIKGYTPARKITLTPKSISKLRNRNNTSRAVPRNEENINFITYVQTRIKSFDNDKFFRELSPESVKIAKANATAIKGENR